MSGLAITSLVLAVAYALILGVLAIAALLNHDLLIAPVWTFILAGIAVALAVLAIVQIRSAEGTRAGLRVAYVALWVGLLPSLGYGAYYIGTYLAVVRVQAERFTAKWFDDIKEGKLKDAFLLTRSPKDRAGLASDPVEFHARCEVRDGDKKGVFTRFEENDLVRAIRQGGPAVKVNSLGIQDWNYKQHVYEVQQSVRIETPEGTYDIVLPLRGIKEKNRRQWQIIWPTDTRLKFTAMRPNALGLGVKLWQQNASGFAGDWIKRRQHGDLVGCYLLTMPPKARHQLGAIYYGRLVALALTLPMAGPASDMNMIVAHGIPPDKGFDAFLSGKKFVVCDVNKLQADPPELKNTVPGIIRNSFASPDRVGLMPSTNPARPEFGTGDNVVQMALDVDLGVRLPDATGVLKPKYHCAGVLKLESDGVPITPSSQPNWRVVEVEVIAASEPGQGPKGRPHMMQMPALPQSPTAEPPR